MNESAMIPEDNDLLLECLQSIEDLQLEEMEPLRNWVNDSSDGELELSKALARSAQLGEELEDVEIAVPKNLQRSVHDYVMRNARAEDEELVAEKAKMVARNKTERPKRFYDHPVLHFSVGFASGLAALFLAGFFLLQTIGWYSNLESNQLAQDATGWFESVQDDRQWNSDWHLDVVDYEWPFEIAAQPLWSSKIKTRYGKATAVELVYKPQAPDRRAVLFLFNSTDSLDAATLSASPQYTTDRLCVGVGQRGETVYALVVDGDQADFAALIEPGGAPMQTAAFNNNHFREAGWWSVSASVISSFEASF